jgi:hypothetical protein
MENITALRAKQALFIADRNARVRGAAATARNKAQWDAYFASNPDPETLCKLAVKPVQYVIARADGRAIMEGTNACSVRWGLDRSRVVVHASEASAISSLELCCDEEDEAAVTTLEAWARTAPFNPKLPWRGIDAGYNGPDLDEESAQ